MEQNQDLIANQLVLGLNTEDHESVLKAGEFPYAKNSVLSDFEGNRPFIQAAYSNELVSQIKQGYTIVNSTFVKEKGINIIFSTDGGIGNEIGIFDCDTKVYTPKLSSECFIFTLNYPIQCVYNYIGCDLHIYWVNGYDEDRHINLDNPPFVRIPQEGTCNEIVTDLLDCEATKISPTFSIPKIDVEKIEETGTLITGSYNAKIAYANENGDALTSYYSITNSIPIIEDSLLDSYEIIQGSAKEKLTNKSITFRLSNVDTSFDYINIAIVKTVNGVPTYELVATVPSGTELYTYTGREVAKPLSINDLIKVYPNYYNSSTITTANNYLIRADLTSVDDLNLQPLANMLGLEWVTYRKKADTSTQTYKNPKEVANFKTYQRDEVVPFAIKFLVKGGYKTSAFHIPGREANTIDLIKLYGNTNNNDLIELKYTNVCDVNNRDYLYNWEVYNTGSVTGYTDDYLINRDNSCYEGSYQYGEMSYIESTDTYPCNEAVWGDLAGKPIRHHKFPDNGITHIHDAPYNNIGLFKDVPFREAYESTNYIYPIGIRLKKTLEQYIQQAVQAGVIDYRTSKLIEGYEIVRGDTRGNKTVIAKGLLYNMWNYKEPNKDEIVMYPNYAYNDLRPDKFLLDSYQYNNSGYPETYPDKGNKAKNPQHYFTNRFTFHSPDTHFTSPFIGTELKLETEEFGACKTFFENVENHPKLKNYPTRTESFQNHAVTVKSVGNYNSYVTVPTGNKRRYITANSYLPANNFTKVDGVQERINNKYRESSLFLQTNTSVNNPTKVDSSRFLMSEVPNYTDFIVQYKSGDTVEDESKKYGFEVDPDLSTSYGQISSYYCSIKRKIPNQYGQISTVKYLSLGKFSNIDQNDVYFGGDTYITRFSVKRKLAYFNQNYIGKNPKNMAYLKDINIPFPRFYLRTAKAASYTIAQDGDRSELDANSLSDNDGFIYLFNYGVPYFFVESSINTDYRYSGTPEWEAYYPALPNTTINRWMEEIHSPITKDNTYYYNFDYNKEPVEEYHAIQDLNFNPNSLCRNTHDKRIIYSKQSNNEQKVNNWLFNLANDYYESDGRLGKIIDVRGLDGYQVLVRYEQGLQLFNAVDTIELTSKTIQVGTGGMFATAPKTYAVTDNGYGGTKSKFCFSSSQFGQLLIDNERGKIYLNQNTLNEISNHKMFNWFSKNIPLKIINQLKDIPNFNLLNTDNPFVGLGFNCIFDNKTNLFFLTKKDYLLKDINNKVNLSVDEVKGLLYNNVPVNFDDTTIWEQCGWTISYSPEYQRWISWYDFLPNFYMQDKLKFYSGINNKVWEHWKEGSHFTYYGKPFSWEIEVVPNTEPDNKILHTLEYTLKAQEYLGNNYTDVHQNRNVNFDKVIVYNDFQSSGILNLVKKDKNNPFASLQYPKVNNDSIDILYSHTEGDVYRLNQFADIIEDKNNGQSVYEYKNDGVTKIFKNLDYSKIENISKGFQKFRNGYFKIRFIQDKNPSYKLMMKTIFNKLLKSFK